MMAIEFRSKIGVWLLLGCGLIGVLLLIRSTSSPECNVSDELKAQAESLASAVAEQQRSVLEEERENLVFLQNLTETLGGIEGLRWVEIFDEDAVVIAHTLPDRVGGKPRSDHEEYVRRLFAGHKAIEEADRENRRFNRFVPVTLPTATGAPRTVAVIEVVMDWEPDQPKATGSSRVVSRAVQLAVRNRFEDIAQERSRVHALVRDLSDTPGVRSLAVYDSDGIALVHSDPDRVGKPAPASCASRIKRVLMSQESVAEICGDTQLHHVVKPVRTSESMQGERAAAVIEVVMDATGSEYALAAARQRTSFLAAVLAAIVGVGLYIAVCKLKLLDQRLERAHEAAYRAAGKRDGWLLALWIVLSLAVFVVDLLIPLGVASAVPYAIVVLATAWSRKRRDTYVAATLATVLTWLGFVFSMAGGVGWIVVANRSLSVFVAWTSALLILQKRRTYEALQLVSRRMQLILDSAGEGIYGLDLDGNTTFVNPAAAKLIGWNADELIGKGQHAILHHTREDGSPYPREECPIYAAFKDGSIHHVSDEVFWRKDGSSFPVEYISTPVWEDGKLTGAVVTFRDISERKEAEQRIRESEAFLRSVIDALDAHIAILDDTGQVIETNDAWRTYFSDNKPSAAYRETGWNYLTVCDSAKGDGAETAQAVAAGIRSVLAGLQDHFALEYPCHGPDRERWFELRVTDFSSDGSRRAVVAHVDTTQRKHAEAALRTSVTAAESADRAKSDFLANMSHEIRTPMTAILGFAENLLLADQPESEKLNCIHTIRRNGEYLLGIINDILDLSKIEAGRMTIEQRNCQPCRIVAEVASLMRVQADAKALPFNCEYIGAIPETIQSDATRLRQILINLVGNAIKFTQSGSVRLVTSLVDDDDVPRLQFDVIDTGSGMTQKQQSRLFQPFMQADTSTTRKFGGTGLGLTISIRLAEMLGGDLTVVATETGVGTTFRATVATGPLDGVKMLEDPVSATVADDASDMIAQTSLSDLPACRILLAEDGPDNQRLLSFVLKKAGADVTVAENGKLALDAALAARDTGHPFDVILMDIQMPVMDGYQATQQLRRKGYSGPIIALTAHAMEGDRERCIKAGCDDYATKPIDRQKLVETIRRNLVNAEAATPAL